MKCVRFLLFAACVGPACGACTYDVKTGMRWSPTAPPPRTDIAVDVAVADEAACASSCDAVPSCLAYTFNSVGALCTTSSQLTDHTTTNNLQTEANHNIGFKLSCTEIESCDFTIIPPNFYVYSRLDTFSGTVTTEPECQSMCNVNPDCTFFIWQTVSGVCYFSARGHTYATDDVFKTGLKRSCPSASCDYERTEDVGLLFTGGVANILECDHSIMDFILGNEAECRSACDATRCVAYVWESAAAKCTTLWRSFQGFTATDTTRVTNIKKNCTRPNCAFTRFTWQAGVRKTATTDILEQDVASAEDCTAFCSANHHCVGMSLNSSTGPLKCTLHSEVNATEALDDASSYAEKIGCVADLSPRVLQAGFGGAQSGSVAALPIGAQYRAPVESFGACTIRCFRDAACTQYALDTSGDCHVYYDNGGGPGTLLGRLMRAL